MNERHLTDNEHFIRVYMYTYSRTLNCFLFSQTSVRIKKKLLFLKVGMICVKDWQGGKGGTKEEPATELEKFYTKPIFRFTRREGDKETYEEF